MHLKHDKNLLANPKSFQENFPGYPHAAGTEMPGDDPATDSLQLRKLWNPENDQTAWRLFMERYHPAIYAWCRQAGLQHADADEISGQVQLKLATAMRNFQYDPTHRFRAWLKTIVDNTLKNYWRDTANRPGSRGTGDSGVHEQLQVAEAPCDVDSLVMQLDESLMGDIERATAQVRQRIKPQTWEAYWMTAIEERSAIEAAERLGMTVAAVYVAKNRVGRMLRETGASLHSSADEGVEG
jgi:RNA polymerase sigma-70 factor (ECF subfamily)